MIKEADVKLDGLTVIAGENDTGKSTVGKIAFILARVFTFYKYGNKQKTINKIFTWLIKQIFKDIVIYKDSNCFLEINEFKITPFKIYGIENVKFLDSIFLETPFVLNMFDTFKSIQPFINSHNPLDIYIDYPYLAWDVYIKSYNNSQYKEKISYNNLLKNMKNFLNGEWKFFEDKKEWRFVKNNNKDFQINNVASGYKQFALLEILLKRGYISKNRILIIDEPEVHLHPKWQVEYAKILVELVKRDVKVLVTSHSPYMIEALYLLAKKEDVKSNFYFAEDGYVKEDNTMERSIKKLVEPMKILKRLRYEEMCRN